MGAHCHCLLSTGTSFLLQTLFHPGNLNLKYVNLHFSFFIFQSGPASVEENTKMELMLVCSIIRFEVLLISFVAFTYFKYKGWHLGNFIILCFAEYFWKTSYYRIVSFLQRFGWHIQST